VGGLACEKALGGKVGRKSHFSLEQIQVKKYIRNEKKYTIM
jgi:hypothetical protein